MTGLVLAHDMHSFMFAPSEAPAQPLPLLAEVVALHVQANVAQARGHAA